MTRLLSGLGGRILGFLLLGETFGGMARAALWQAQGPFRITGGLVEGMEAQGSPVAGAIKVVRVHPFENNTLYVAAVNGGIWKTTNAWDPNEPAWFPLTDDQPSLSITALEFDPTDPTGETLVAGMGRSSAFASNGGRFGGLLRTTNGGRSWEVLTSLTNQSVSVVAARGNVLLAGSLASLPNYGLYRSTDMGKSAQLVSPPNGSSWGEITSLVGDPANPGSLWLASPGKGIFLSSDIGATWRATAPIPGLAADDINVQLAFQRYAQGSVLYAGVIGRDNVLTSLVRSTNLGAGWESMTLPVGPDGVTGLHPGGQGRRNFSIVADPFDPNVVYVGGDRQPQYDDGVGSQQYTGRLFRGDARFVAATNQWQALTHSFTTNGSAPHADSRALIFDNTGARLIDADDGGIYFRSSPRDTHGAWFSLNGNLAVTETHTVAWDAGTRRFVAGAQDNGVIVQTAPRSGVWTTLIDDDGGKVAVANTGSGSSVVYGSEQRLGLFTRFLADSNFMGSGVSFMVDDLQGPMLPDLASFDSSIPFYPLLRVNAADPHQLAIGTQRVLIGTDSLGTNIVLKQIFSFDESVSGLAFGGQADGTRVTNVLYAAAGSNLWLYANAASNQLSYPGGEIRDLILDPEDWRHVFAVDSQSAYGSFDAGSSWKSLGGPPAERQFFPRCLTFVSSEQGPGLVVGGSAGVYAMSFRRPGVWLPIGENLPQAVTWEIHYSAADDLLYAALLGRGIWSLENPGAVVNPPVLLRWARIAGQWQLQWDDPGFQLQTSGDFQQWTTLPGLSPFTLRTVGEKAFFRLIQEP